MTDDIIRDSILKVIWPCTRWCQWFPDTDLEVSECHFGHMERLLHIKYSQCIWWEERSKEVQSKEQGKNTQKKFSIILDFWKLNPAVKSIFNLGENTQLNFGKCINTGSIHHLLDYLYSLISGQLTIVLITLIFKKQDKASIQGNKITCGYITTWSMQVDALSPQHDHITC